MALRRTATIAIDDAERRLRNGMARRLYEAKPNAEHGWRVVFLDITDFALDQRCADGLNFLGYQLCAAAVQTMSKPSPMFLTPREMDLIAGQAFRRGKSRTVRFGANEALRKAYAESQAKVTGRQMPLEDAIECAVVKLSGMHPGIGLADRMVTRNSAQRDWTVRTYDDSEEFVERNTTTKGSRPLMAVGSETA